MSEQPVADGWCIPDALWERIAPLLPPQRTYPTWSARACLIARR